MSTLENQSLFEIVKMGGWVIYFLLACSILLWAIILERAWRFKSLGQELREFQFQALNALLRSDTPALKSLCEAHSALPTARLIQTALERLGAKDARVRVNWGEALERKRQMINQELRQNLWILGTLASASPFVGLYGTVVGILRSFAQIAKTGAGGFTTVAGGISEALIATAGGILVAVIALIAYNAFQTRWSSLVLTIRLYTEELAEVLGATHEGAQEGPRGV